MAGRPGKDSPARIDPRTGRPLPEGIRWRTDRQRYQIRVVGPSVDGGAAERSRMFLTLAEAKRELAKVIAGRNPNGSMTLEQWHERYWPAIEASVRPATARCYDVGWRLRVKPSLGRHRLEDITSPMIESAMVTWSGGASAKNDALAVLSRLLDAARRSRFIDYNPAREVKRPSMRESVSPISRALTLEQITTLLALVPEGVYRRYLATLVYTGMRAGEATALRVRDVDFAHSIIRVSRSLSPGRNGELVEQSPKSHRSREVPLIAALRPYVEDAARGKETGRPTAVWSRRRAAYQSQRAPRCRLGCAADGDRTARPADARPPAHLRHDPVRRRGERAGRAGDPGALQPSGHRAVLPRSRGRRAACRGRARPGPRRRHRQGSRGRAQGEVRPRKWPKNGPHSAGLGEERGDRQEKA